MSVYSFTNITSIPNKLFWMDLSLSIPVKSIYNILIRITFYFKLVCGWLLRVPLQAMSTYLTVWYVSLSLLHKLDIETFLMWIGLTRMFAIDLAFGLGFWYSHNLNWILCLWIQILLVFWHPTRTLAMYLFSFTSSQLPSVRKAREKHGRAEPCHQATSCLL